FGALDTEVFTREELDGIRKSGGAEIVEACISDPGDDGHLYFQTNPAVSSDVVLMMRYGFRPGADHGRPLRVMDNGLWAIDDNYPNAPGTETTQPASTKK